MKSYGLTVAAMAAATVALLPAPLRAQSAGSTYVPAVLSGQSAGSGGTNFGTLSTPAIDQTGHIVFTGGVVDGDAAESSDSGIWSGRPGSIFVVAREGSIAPLPAPDPDTLYGQFTISIVPNISAQGQVLFRNDLTGPNVTLDNQQTLWIGTPQSLSLLTRAGTGNAPGSSPTSPFSGYGSPDEVNETAGAAFHAQLASGNFGVWSGQIGGLAKIVQTGEQVAPGEQTFYNVFGNNPAINSAGTIALLALQFTGPDARDSIFDGAIVTGTSNSLQSLARYGDSAPGSGGGTFTFILSQPNVNSSGTVVFSAQVSTGSIGIFAGTTPETCAAARTGQVAPGTGGLLYTSVGTPVIGGAGDIAFPATLTGGAYSIWSGIPEPAEDNGVQLIARSGNVAPQTGGATFRVLSTPVVNSRGQVAFRATLNNDNSNFGIFAIDPFGQLVKVVRVGDSVPISPTQTANVLTVEFSAGSGGQDGKPLSFTDTSQLAFRATLDNGQQGIYVARVGGAARIESNLPLASFGPETANLVVGGSESQGYSPATAEVSSNIGYVRYSGIQETGADVYVYLKVVGTAAGLQAVQQELATGQAAYHYTVQEVTPGGPLTGFNLLLSFAQASDGATQTFFWNLTNIEGADLAAIAVVPEPVQLTSLAAIFILSRARPRRSRKTKQVPQG